MANLVDIIRGIINDIDLVIEVESTNGVRVDVCSTLHITVGKIVTDALGQEYKVTDFSNNEWIDVEPFGATVDPFAGATITAPPILFLHGSPSSTNSEYLETDTQTLEKTPFRRERQTWLAPAQTWSLIPSWPWEMLATVIFKCPTADLCRVTSHWSAPADLGKELPALLALDQVGALVPCISEPWGAGHLTLLTVVPLLCMICWRLVFLNWALPREAGTVQS